MSGSAARNDTGRSPISQPCQFLAPRIVAQSRVVMLVSNACVNDTRVIRAAETVAEQGFDTIVLAMSDDHRTSEEWRNGVHYRRLGRPWIAVRTLPPKEEEQEEAAPGDVKERVPALERLIIYLKERASAVAVLRALAESIRRGARPLKLSRRRISRKIYRTIVRAYHRGAVALDKALAIRGLPARRILGAPFRLARKIRLRWIGFRTAAGRRFRALQKGVNASVKGVKTRGKGFLTRRMHFVLFRPLFDTRRMTRMFEADIVSLQPDIIHAHDLVMLPAGVVAAKAVGAKLVYDAHELEVHRNTKTGIIDKWLRYYLERKHIRQCDAVVTVCDSIADYLARAYAIKRPIVVMNAPDVEQVIPCDIDLRTSLGLSADTPLAMYVGRITVGRGIEQIVDALQYLPEFHLALVGPVNKPTVAFAQARSRELGFADRVHVVPPVAPGMILSFIRSGDISLVPIQNVCLSYYYCLPNKLLESALARLPVVVSNLPELKRFIDISGAGVVMDETDPRDIARAMREAYDNRQNLRPDPERLRRAEEIYGWATQKRTLNALYASFELLPEQASVTTEQLAPPQASAARLHA